MLKYILLTAFVAVLLAGALSSCKNPVDPKPTDTTHHDSTDATHHDTTHVDTPS